MLRSPGGVRILPSACCGIVALAAQLAWGQPCLAQAITGRVLAGESGAPLTAAVVTLVDSAGRERRAMLSDSAGKFRLIAPWPGRWRVRAQHIGRTTASTQVTLGPGMDADVRLEAPIAPVMLQPLTVTASSVCQVHPDARELTAQLWEEARKAFRVSSLARRSRWFVLREFDRELDPASKRVLTEQVRGAGGVGGRPFGSATEEHLNEFGYVQKEEDGWAFWAPDDDVLLSDGFLDHHCIEFRGGRQRPRQGLVGIAFQPMQHIRPDIAGVVWLDARTAEVHSVDFHFTALGWDVPDEATSGRLEFLKLRSGAIVINRWYLRMPVGSRPHYRLMESGAELVDPEATGKPTEPAR